jgi:hypothetical protein
MGVRAAVEEKLRNSEPITEEERTQIEGDMATDINNAVYTAALVYERAEGLGLLYGNGHHMAQEIALEAANRLKERFQKAREIDAAQTTRRNLSVV